VHLSVRSLAIVGRERLEEVITNRLVRALGLNETAGALSISHVVTFVLTVTSPVLAVPRL